MTSHCPVCFLPAEQGRSRDYADKKQFLCPRCGGFEISRTALAMLKNRLDQDPLSRARLSHAIRAQTSEDNWPFVSSANLDEMAEQPLPGVPQQLNHLIIWIASQLGDDTLGRIGAPASDTLAGLIGTADGERVERLIEYAEREGLVERDKQGELLGLSPTGWESLNQSINADAEKEQLAPHNVSPDAIKAHCNECGGNRNASIRASHTVRGSDGEVSWSDTYEVLECCGCSGVSVRNTYWFSEWDQIDTDPLTGNPRMTHGEKVTYWPPQSQRTKPNWADDLDDETLRNVFNEVYQALNSGMIILASIGTRTLLDRAMLLCVGDTNGGFAGKLDLMVENGHIGKDEKETLKIITDAGSASAHRGFAPNAMQLDTIIDITEAFLRREFVMKPKVHEIKTATPPRAPVPHKKRPN